MATLTSEDHSNIKKFIKSDPTYRVTFKLWSLSKDQWIAAFQAAEDWFVNGFSATPTESFKAAIEAQTGAATNAQVKAVGWVWMKWRQLKNP